MCSYDGGGQASRMCISRSDTAIILDVTWDGSVTWDTRSGKLLVASLMVVGKVIYNGWCWRTGYYYEPGSARDLVRQKAPIGAEA